MDPISTTEILKFATDRVKKQKQKVHFLVDNNNNNMITEIVLNFNVTLQKCYQ